MVKMFRKKPVVISAMKAESGTADALLQWVHDNEGVAVWYDPWQTGFIKTLEGDMVFKLGDWIIRGVQGEFYPCRGDIFAETYEEVNDAE